MIEDTTVIEIRARTLPEAWENSVVACWEGGARFKTEYDKAGDPESRDVTANIIVFDPMAEPRIHRAIPAGLGDLEIYRQEVLFGVHDNWIDPAAGKWEYTYHERLYDYRVPGVAKPVNQIEAVIEKLARTPHTRRAQAVTWQCWMDLDCVDPACLQRMWFRIQDDRLLLNVSMRSNDAFKAAFMNMYAFTDLQRWMAARLSQKMGREIKVGRYIHSADSYHIYGSYFTEFERFLQMRASKDFSERVLETADVQYFLDEGKLTLFNNTQSSVLLPIVHLKRLWEEIPED
ncbi:MAG: thymidylate synthase, partial [Candidatus Sumerlaeota bacterium]|nr:thymidylate synthase [Candidatus Sumerlaeota bacterium]